MKVFVDKIKFIIALLTAIVFLLLSVLFLLLHIWFLAIISLVLLVVYLVLAALNGRIVHFNDDFIQVKLLGVKQREVLWSDIREVGIAGVKVLKSKNSGWSGAKYVYFSPVKMNDQDRFNMCLEWPPKDIIYFRFNYKNIKKVIRIWGGDIIQYNTESLDIYG